MKVYVLLLWFLEGDCELVNSFKGVFSSYDRAVKEKNDIDKMGCEIVSSTEAEARTYKHNMYGDPFYFEIRECDVVGQNEQLVCPHCKGLEVYIDEYGGKPCKCTEQAN